MDKSTEGLRATQNSQISRMRRAGVNDLKSFSVNMALRGMDERKPTKIKPHELDYADPHLKKFFKTISTAYNFDEKKFLHKLKQQFSELALPLWNCISKHFDSKNRTTSEIGYR